MNAPRIALLGAAGLLAAATLTACSTAEPSVGQCAIVTGRGVGDDQTVKSVARPGEKITIGDAEIAWYVPCNARNYVTQPGDGGDRKEPQTVKTGARGDQTGMPVKVYTRVYWQLNQTDEGLKSFFPVCLKYGCASQTPQTDAANANDQQYSTPGWNGMLRENFGPAIDAATGNATGEFGPDLWADRSQWAKLGEQIATGFAGEIRKEVGGNVDFFCGIASDVAASPSADKTGTAGCSTVRVEVTQVKPADPQIEATYNQQVAASYAKASNTARLGAAREVYGAWAEYFLGLQDTVKYCNGQQGCVIYVGSPQPPAAAR